MLKKTIIGIIGVASLLLATSPADAATFDDMKDEVQNNGGVIYHPELARDMTVEEAANYIDIIEEEQSKLQTTLVTTEIQEKALKAVASKATSVTEITSIPVQIPILTRGTSVPTKKYTLTGKTYTSNLFSGSGWRFSELYFVFDNYVNNPYFGVRSIGDGFNFHRRNNQMEVAKDAVEVSNSFRFFPSYSGANLNGYFSTWNPVSGSYYEIN